MKKSTYTANIAGTNRDKWANCQQKHHQTGIYDSSFCSGVSVCAELQVSDSDLTWVSALSWSQKNWLQYKHAYWTTSLYTVPRYIYTSQAYIELPWKASRGSSICIEWKNKYFAKKQPHTNV